MNDSTREKLQAQKFIMDYGISIPQGGIPFFLDIEASSFWGYPIEIAWSTGDGSIESHLITPVDTWTTEDWDEDAQRVHGIPYQELFAEGKSALWVAERMNFALEHRVVYTDAVPYDQVWLDKLYKATNFSASFTLGYVQKLFYDTFQFSYDDWHGHSDTPEHRAAADVRRIMELYISLLKQK